MGTDRTSTTQQRHLGKRPSKKGSTVMSIQNNSTTQAFAGFAIGFVLGGIGFAIIKIFAFLLGA